MTTEEAIFLPPSRFMRRSTGDDFNDLTETERAMR
jgi:hypothetical protein